MQAPSSPVRRVRRYDRQLTHNAVYSAYCGQPLFEDTGFCVRCLKRFQLEKGGRYWTPEREARLKKQRALQKVKAALEELEKP